MAPDGTRWHQVAPGGTGYRASGRDFWKFSDIFWKNRKFLNQNSTINNWCFLMKIVLLERWGSIDSKTNIVWYLGVRARYELMVWTKSLQYFVQTISSYRALTRRYQTILVLECMEPHLSNKTIFIKKYYFFIVEFWFKNFRFFQKMSEIFQKSLPEARDPVPLGATF